MIELILVLVVLAVAGGLAVPALQPALQAVRGESAARRTASFLDDVRRRAILQHTRMRVLCEPDQNRLQIDAGDKSGRNPEETPTFRIPEDAELVSCQPDQVDYYPQGYASGLTLTLRDRRLREYEVKVGSFTGLTRVESSP